jgi:hypothetical protein
MQYQRLFHDQPMFLLPEVQQIYLPRYRSSGASLGYAPDRDTLPPHANAKNGISIGPPLVKNFRMSESRLPRIIPISIGTITATNDIRGMFAITALPRAIIVRKGPSFIERIAIAPTSVSYPDSHVSATYKPPLLFDRATIIASDDNPRKPAEPNTFATIRPIITATRYLEVNNTPPFIRAFGAALKLIPPPIQNQEHPNQSHCTILK